MSIPLTPETDVLIAGAGPTGLTLACELLRRGIRCRIVDRMPEPARTSRALGIQPRTLEVFADLGIVDEVLARGVRAAGARIYDRDTLLLHLRLDHLQAPYPYVLVVPQSGAEQVLLGLLHRLGGVVERGRELVDFREEGDAVVATVRAAGDEVGPAEQIRAGWLVGCDGAHSRVRKALGLAFEGSTYEEAFLLADVDLDWGRSRDETHGWLHRDGLFAALPLPRSRQWRLFADVSAGAGAAAPQATVELFQRLLVERTGDTATTISNPSWLSTFRINRRMVPEYRRGRVFLAGDAAHIHSPFGGQGMNTGIQDAYNLAWKLGLVVRGRATGALLDTYQEERLPVAREVLHDTHRNTNLLLAKHALARFARDHVLVPLLRLGAIQARLVREASELYVHYRRSSLSRSRGGPLARRFPPLGGPRAGDRAPDGPGWCSASGAATSLHRELRGTGFTLLLFGGRSPTPARWRTLSGIARQVEAAVGREVVVQLVVGGDEPPATLDWAGRMLLDPGQELHGSYGANAGALYLVRPDGYVGFRGTVTGGKAVLGYLRRLFGDAMRGPRRVPKRTRTPSSPTLDQATQR